MEDMALRGSDWAGHVFALAKKIVGTGPLGIARLVLRMGALMGAKSTSYHVAPPVDLWNEPPSYKFFASRRALSHMHLSRRDEQTISQLQDEVIRGGLPVSLRSMVDTHAGYDTHLAGKVVDLVGSIGIVDEFVVPVFGPFRVNGVISFGFCQRVDTLDSSSLEAVAMALPSFHAELVRIFSSSTERNDNLSRREQQVLGWIARGKSTADIAMIMHLSEGSIDTYTRRIFKKLKVNDRVSAAVRGVTGGIVAA